MRFIGLIINIHHHVNTNFKITYLFFIISGSCAQFFAQSLTLNFLFMKYITEIIRMWHLHTKMKLPTKNTFSL
jgi:hypothetical protein